MAILFEGLYGLFSSLSSLFLPLKVVAVTLLYHPCAFPFILHSSTPFNSWLSKSTDQFRNQMSRAARSVQIGPEWMHLCVKAWRYLFWLLKLLFKSSWCSAVLDRWVQVDKILPNQRSAFLILNRACSWGPFAFTLPESTKTHSTVAWAKPQSTAFPHVGTTSGSPKIQHALLIWPPRKGSR